LQYRKLGHTDIEISAIIFGGWQSGGSQWSNVDDKDTVAAHRAALAGGVTTFDTAEAYGNGHSEEILGQALSDHRDEIKILTKVFAYSLHPDKLRAACEKSLARLRTDHIDLYQIHWPSGTFNSPVIPIEDTMGALVGLKEQGKIRAIGVSNFSYAQIEEASQYGPVESLQPPYSLFWRKVEEDAGKFCYAKGLSILAYSPLAQGLLTGKFHADNVFPKDDNRSSNKLFLGEEFKRALAAVDQLRPIAAKHGITVGQLSLAWLIAQPNTNAIVGARTPEQASQNAAAGDVTLSADEIAAIDSIGRTVTSHQDKNPVMWTWGG